MKRTYEIIKADNGFILTVHYESGNSPSFHIFEKLENAMDFILKDAEDFFSP